MAHDKTSPDGESIKMEDEALIGGTEPVSYDEKTPEERKKDWEQEQAPWIPFEEDNVDENFERIAPSPEQIEEMDKRLEELCDVFEGSNFNWRIDGALNISLMNGKYIGFHKDIDLSFEKNELAMIESYLSGKGYGFFLSNKEGGMKNKGLKKVSFREFHESQSEHMLIAAMDGSGRMPQGKALDYMDVHLIERNEAGKAIGISRVEIPEKWSKAYPVNFNGRTINLSHPGKVLYYKLQQSRGYDMTDAKRLIETGKLSEEDVNDIEKVFEREFAADIKRGVEIFNAVAENFSPEMSAEEILEILLEQPDFNKRSRNNPNFFLKFAQKIHESRSRTAQGMVNIAIDFFKVEELDHQKQEELRSVRKLVKEREMQKA